ncbi:MAG: RimK family alpha-L-glutamate ligase [Halobacteriales archaeon]|nr:RimK family alpha-L-glutamate ligase [Halobacteriales archaeon]
MGNSAVRVGVLSLHKSKETKAILNAVESLGHRPEWLREENTVVDFEGGRAAMEPEVDVIANRLLLTNTEQPAEALGIAYTLDRLRPMLNRPSATARASHKLATAASLTAASLPFPRTVLALSGEQLNRLRDSFGDEAVYKTAIGTHGGGVWRVGRGDMLAPMVGNRRALLQALVTTDGDPRDLRVYVVGDRVVGAMYRYAADGDWRTNVARGGSVQDATEDLDAEVDDLARSAARAVGLDYAGVDLIEAEAGWQVLEVNPTAGFRGLYEATGRSPAPHIAAQAIETAGGSVDADRVRELSATLDDSTPSCTPYPEPTSYDEPVTIGFTERVVVTGTSGTRTVVAQADTGAARTSVDLRLAAEIGAGPIHSDSRDSSAATEAERSRPVVDLVLGIGGRQHTVAANIEDRDQRSHPLLLGRDVLKHYRLDVSQRVEAARAEVADGDEE